LKNTGPERITTPDGKGLEAPNMHFIAAFTRLDCCQQGELLIADCYKVLLEVSDA
jgi:hypothetical protein